MLQEFLLENNCYKQKLAPQEEEIVPMSERIKQFIDDYGFFALLIILIIALMLSVMPRKKNHRSWRLNLQRREVLMLMKLKKNCLL